MCYSLSHPTLMFPIFWTWLLPINQVQRYLEWAVNDSNVRLNMLHPGSQEKSCILLADFPPPGQHTGTVLQSRISKRSDRLI